MCSVLIPKTPGSKLTWERVSRGHILFRVKNYPEVGRKLIRMGSDVNPFRVYLTLLRVSLTMNGVWLQYSLFPVTSDPQYCKYAWCMIIRLWLLFILYIAQCISNIRVQNENIITVIHYFIEFDHGSMKQILKYFKNTLKSLNFTSCVQMFSNRIILISCFLIFSE